ncbi:PREDICTED: lipoxygenase homology domain-containing protein 1-like [Branchiostoma belcheri]|uniref:Lipoxygenase homology domain-containing protein 1-like n=1 Tax=Branchiostoma belcheri TaxID=7741 RepID=A0A6P4ZKX9_BRABE|nr:PREDICTED: lipoxygenase homology domain-containing protein 1-like [Branchiostoma belcheri]
MHDRQKLRGYSEVVRVQYRDTDGPNNNGQSPGDLVSKVKVWHDNSGLSPGWFLNKVVVQNLKTGLQQEFPFYRWLSRGRDDNRIAREVAMNGSGDGQVKICKVRFTTADKWSATSSSPVIVSLVGSLGQSERIQVLGELKRGRYELEASSVQRGSPE